MSAEAEGVPAYSFNLSLIYFTNRYVNKLIKKYLLSMATPCVAALHMYTLPTSFTKYKLHRIKC